MSKPVINVTPLIDVLLVLLIIFMIAAPQKPTDFKTKIPQEAKQMSEKPNPYTLVVAIVGNASLRLNQIKNLGTVGEPQPLIKKLSEVFADRTENHVYTEGLATREDLPEAEKIEKTVFIKAPRSLDYGSVAKVIDAVKMSGANPISLQIDALE
ncbi:MAG TPA: biopolymer transporter ExbD [Pyrinomonadaceae bacterium]